MNRHVPRMLALAALVVSLGAAAPGCSHSHVGREAVFGDTVNLRITNRDSERIHIYVDGDSVGDVRAGGSTDFAIRPGTRRLEIRESGQVSREWQGDYDFSTSSIIRFVYDPSVLENFTVENTSAVDMEVFVDLEYVGTVRVGQTRGWLIRSGRWDVDAREEGTFTLDWIGRYNFNTSEHVQLTFEP